MTDGAGTVVLDLDGVVYLDAQGIPGAGQALASLAERGVALRYATNNSSKTASDVVRHIEQRTGFRADPSSVVTSSQATAVYVAERFSRAAVVGPPALERELLAHGVDVVPTDAADAVVVGLDRHLTYETIDEAARAIRAGAAFVASNTDSTYPTPTGLAPGAGTIVAALATASGRDPVVCGKPTPIFAEALTSQIAPVPVWMVGDRIETDIALGHSQGWVTVLVLTGVTDAPDVDDLGVRPHHIIPSIADLPELVLGSTGGGTIGG